MGIRLECTNSMDEWRSKPRVTYRKYEIVRLLREAGTAMLFDELCFAVFVHEHWPRGVESNRSDGILPTERAPSRSYRSSFARTCHTLQEEARIKRWYIDPQDLPVAILARTAAFRSGAHPLVSWAVYQGEGMRADVTINTRSELLPGKRNGYFLRISLTAGDQDQPSVVNVPLSLPCMFITANVDEAPDVRKVMPKACFLTTGPKRLTSEAQVVGHAIFRSFGRFDSSTAPRLRETYRPQLTAEEESDRDMGRPWVLDRKSLTYIGQQ